MENLKGNTNHTPIVTFISDIGESLEGFLWILRRLRRY